MGKLLRLPFRLIPKDAVLPVVSGALRGKKWIKGSHNISVLLGTYEKHQTFEFYNCAKQKKIFWDLGAHVGYYSLLFHTANPSGHAYGFEPLPLNARLYSRHMDLNRAHNHHLFQVAVSNQAGTFTFNLGRTSVAGKLATDGSEDVEVIRLSEWVKDGKIPLPDLIKMDIEGEEIKVLNDLKEILKTARPDVFLSTHGPAIHSGCVSLLKELNYSLKPLDANSIVSCKEFLATSH